MATFTPPDIEQPAAVAHLCAEAALNHGLENGDLRMAIGDLEIALCAALRALAPAARRAVFAELRDTISDGFLDFAEFDESSPDARFEYLDTAPE